MLPYFGRIQVFALMLGLVFTAMRIMLAGARSALDEARRKLASLPVHPLGVDDRAEVTALMRQVWRARREKFRELDIRAPVTPIDLVRRGAVLLLTAGIVVGLWGLRLENDLTEARELGQRLDIPTETLVRFFYVREKGERPGGDLVQRWVVLFQTAGLDLGPEDFYLPAVLLRSIHMAHSRPPGRTCGLCSRS